MSEASALERTALELLAIPSVTGSEGAIADYVERRLAALRPHRLVRHQNNLVVQARSQREGAPRILLVGHLDTVPPSKENAPRLDDDRLYGLGASDMKAADAVLLELLARAADETPRVDLIVAFYAGEEGPYVASGLPGLRAAAPDLFENVALAVCLEPSDNTIELGCLGTMHVGVRFTGVRAHSARPWQGRNAIHMAAPFLAAVAAHPERRVDCDGLLYREVLSATMLAYEGARNVVPASCLVNVNFRFGPDRDEASARDVVARLVDKATPAAWREAGWVESTVTDFAPSGRVVRRNPWVVRLEALLEGRPPQPKQAWTDVGRLSVWGIDAISFGPGSGSQAHQAGEWCSRAHLAACADLLGKWLF